MYELFLTVFVFLLVGVIMLLTAIILVPLYYIILISYKKFYNTTLPTLIRKRLKISFFLFALLFASYQTFRAFYPSDSFFFNEFKEVTLREPPESSKIIKKNASYPDFHGDYSSSCQIKLSKKDYQYLLFQISKDTRFAKEDYYNLIIINKKLKCSYLRYKAGKSDHRLQIIFMDDLETIIVNIDVS